MSKRILLLMAVPMLCCISRAQARAQAKGEAAAKKASTMAGPHATGRATGWPADRRHGRR